MNINKNPLRPKTSERRMPKQKKKIEMTLIVASLLFLLHTGCYRMPNHDEFSVVPTTNNPDVIGKNNANWMPTTGF
jgi:hypothetical protein